MIIIIYAARPRLWRNASWVGSRPRKLFNRSIPSLDPPRYRYRSWYSYRYRYIYTDKDTHTHTDIDIDRIDILTLQEQIHTYR